MRNQLTLKRALLVASLTSVALLTAQPAAACGSEPYIGEVCTFTFGWCPQGYAAANGQMLPINQNQALYSLLGTTYGGDGRTNFALPDLRGRVVVGAGAGAPGLPAVTLGQKRGAESVSVSPLPTHTHPATVASTAGPTYGVSSGQAVPTVPPELGLNFCIATQGIYPARP